MSKYTHPHERCTCVSSRKRRGDVLELKMAACFDGNCSKHQKTSRFSLSTRSRKFDGNTETIQVQVLKIEDFVERRTKEPKIRVYGVDSSGHVVTILVHDFRPYFFVVPPKSTQSSTGFTSALNDEIRRLPKPSWLEMDRYIRSTEPEMKQSIQGYQPGQRLFWRIILMNQRVLSLARRVVVEQFNVPCFEANVQYVYRFMIDHNVRGGGWIELPRLRYTHDVSQDIYQLSANNLIARNDINDIAPLHILSFDIECTKITPGGFPSPTEDPVIQIANYVLRYGDSEPIIRNVFVLHGCDDIDPDTSVHAFDREEDLLLEWRHFVQLANPGQNLHATAIGFLISKKTNQMSIFFLSHMIFEFCLET